MSETGVIRGFKVFNPDWTCRDKQYTCPGAFEEDVAPSVCDRGMHFCKKAADCFNYYSFNPENKVAEVIALAERTVEDGDKCATNYLEIVPEVSGQEVLENVNTGKGCTGLCNSGDCNSGDGNSGYCNSGDCNSGDWNSGNRNSGNRNSGDWNSGDWNNTNFSNGCFNTVEQKIMLFNKQSDITYRDWCKSDARYLLNQIPKDVVEWIYSDNMTDEEKEQHPTYKTTDGYLKKLDETECGQLWWDSLSNHQKNIIKAIPNFDAEIFFQCTGIRTN